MSEDKQVQSKVTVPLARDYVEIRADAVTSVHTSNDNKMRISFSKLEPVGREDGIALEQAINGLLTLDIPESMKMAEAILERGRTHLKRQLAEAGLSTESVKVKN